MPWGVTINWNMSSNWNQRVLFLHENLSMISFKILGKFTHQWKDVKKHKFSAYNFMVLNYPWEDRRKNPYLAFLSTTIQKKVWEKSTSSCTERYIGPCHQVHALVLIWTIIVRIWIEIYKMGCNGIVGKNSISWCFRKKSI